MINDQEKQELGPYGQYEEVNVTFPETAGTDLIVRHSLKPYTPEHIDYEIVRQNQPAIVYHDGSASRIAWQDGYIVLRCDMPNAKMTLRLSVRHKQQTLDLNPVEIPVVPPETSTLLDQDIHTDTIDQTVQRAAMIVGNSTPKWTKLVPTVTGQVLKFDGNDLVFSTNGAELTSLNASNISSGTLADARLSFNIPLKDTNASITGTYYFNTNPVFNGAAIPEAALQDDSLLARLAANETISGNWSFTPGIKERSRNFFLGEWTSVSYNSGDFTASAGTWTVDSGDVSLFKYTVVGKMMTVVFRLLATSTGAGMGTELRIAVPGGFTPVGITPGLCHLNLNGTYEIGLLQANSAGYIQIFRTNFTTNFTSSLTNTLDVRGQITFEV